ncbi:hypothetical protein [Staphylococcus aureus]
MSVRNPKLFVTLNHTVNRDSRPNVRYSQNNWDFLSVLPETLP